LSGSGDDGFNGFVVISVGLFEIDLSLLKDFGVISNSLFKRGDGVSLFVNLIVQSSNGLITDGLIGSVLGIGFLLFVGDLSNDFVNQEGYFFKGG